MASPITKISHLQPAATAAAQLFEDWFDPIETMSMRYSRQQPERLIGPFFCGLQFR
jgi:hypothetical protein